MNMFRLTTVILCLGIVIAQEDVTLGISKLNPGTSCNDIYQRNPFSRGRNTKYWISTSEGLFEVPCNMKLKCGGIEGGWMQVIDVDMDRDTSCLAQWHYITSPRRLCLGYVIGCAPAHFYVKGVSYEHICGQAKAYQKGNTDAFHTAASIDNVYVEGISITLGSPRKHVWTYAAGLSDDGNLRANYYNCPCATHPGEDPPSFVGNDYYCESGDVGSHESPPYYLSDPLWDGKGCGNRNSCCAKVGMPWFYKKLPVPVAEDFEVRICKDESHTREDVAVEKLELFVI